MLCDQEDNNPVLFWGNDNEIPPGVWKAATKTSHLEDEIYGAKDFDSR